MKPITSEEQEFAKKRKFHRVRGDFVRRHRIVFCDVTVWKSANVIDGKRSGVFEHENLIDALSRPVSYVEFSAALKEQAIALNVLKYAAHDATINGVQFARLLCHYGDAWGFSERGKGWESKK